MRTLAYQGPSVVHVHATGPEPVDAFVQITATRIWAGDHPLWEGRRDFAEGALVRHESLADVLEVGTGASVARVGDVVYLRLTVGCGECVNCQTRSDEECLTAGGGADVPDVTAAAWSIRAPELADAWRRITRLLHAHGPGLHSAPLGRAVLSHAGSDGLRPEETPIDYRPFNRWDDVWVSVAQSPGRMAATNDTAADSAVSALP